MLALLGFGLGFATIHAEEVPQGIMPNKRQVVGTGVTSSTSTVDSTSSSAIETTSSTSVDPVTTSSSSVVTTDPPTSTSTPPTTSDPPTSSTIPSDTTSATPDPNTTSDPVTSPSTTPDGSSSTDGPSASETLTTSNTEVIADSTSSLDPSATPTQDSSTSSQAESSTLLPTTIAVTTTNADGSTVTSSVKTSTLAPVTSRQTSSGVVKTLTGSASNLVVIGSSTIDRSTLTGKTTITSALLAEATIPSTYTSYWTSNGVVQSRLVTTNHVVTSTTGYATATLKPALQNGGGSGGNLSTSSKSIIGGVVGGIGGAILIGGIALVAWRLWGKKKRQGAQQDDFLDSRDDSIRREKRASQGLQAPPDRYHNPSGPVNPSSNF
ncbi:hypothetical protein LTR56_015732 [Elasticomyces elasticus]|nr:hypothetical protein LTR56_015732 [Elasticomyces elasticus]KAK3659237.1 hypothetical protein LTR22_008504 [Elasticomyces elasticus]KAK4914763.1 hypothetical protein LTR49_016998 [Elasticomyces elasticus]KAK5754233.1 hypothetical protein LTS12_015643 [Elasticomyces elasticus]